MKSLFEQIKAKQLASRKARDHLQTAAYTCVLGDVQQISKEPTDAQVVAVLRKHIKSLSETIEHVKGNSVLETEARYSRSMLELFMPCPFTDAEVGMIIGNLFVAHDNVNIGMVMGAVKKAAAERDKEFDGKQVQRVFAAYNLSV